MQYPNLQRNRLNLVPGCTLRLKTNLRVDNDGIHQQRYWDRDQDREA